MYTMIGFGSILKMKQSDCDNLQAANMLQLSLIIISLLLP